MRREGENMTGLKALARTRSRSGQEFHTLSQADLLDYARRHHLTHRQAVAEALREGLFPECYERNFPSLSCPEQLRLFDSSVLVAGLGGLGGTLTTLLARVGVGRLLLADGDVFAPSNLNRQWLATQATLGLNKAEVATRNLQDINPALLAEAIPANLTAANLAPCLAQVQVALDGLDSLPARRDLFTAAQAAGVPLVHGAAQGRFGQVATILPDDPGAFHRIYGEASRESHEPREILAPTASLIASLQVQEALRLLLGKPPLYRGRLAHYDGDTGCLELLSLG